MYIESVRNRNSPPAILLRESYRENGKVRKHTLCNLSDWPTAHVEGLRGVLKGGTVIAPDRDAFVVTRSLPHGHAALAIGVARKIGLASILGPAGNACRDLVLAMIVARIIDPGSKLATAWALSPATATSSLGTTLDLCDVDEDELYTALDWLREHQPAIETALEKRHLKNGKLVLYDASSCYMEGHCCSLAHRGYSRDGGKGTLQIFYGLLCAPDGCPLCLSGWRAMLVVETIGRIRREHLVKGKSIKEIARDLKISRNTVRKILRSGETSFSYEREVQPRPRPDRWKADLDRLLTANAGTSARERLTLIRLFEELRALGYEGGYDSVRRYARTWSREHASQTAAAFVPLSFAPGDAYQFDWSHEIVVMNGVTVTVKVAHVRLCHSRMMFFRTYPRETQEMAFDAHERAFAFFRGACTRGIYDNMKTAVDTIFIGKDRRYNRRFLQMCNHHLVDPVACTPASGWEKGQVENQVGLVQERFFTPRLRVKTYDELNAWLTDKCVAYAKVHPHPERPDQTVWEVFEEERPNLVAFRGRFDGFHALPASVSKTCLVRFGNNKYSVNASAVGRPVEIHAYADRIVIRQDGRAVAEHARHHGRGETIYDPWHYVPIDPLRGSMARKPGALRNGAPFKDWVLPAALERVRRKLAGSDDGDRQMVAILATVLTDGLPAVEAACAQAMSEGVHSSDVIINILARRRDPGPAASSLTPDALRLRHAPLADCARYDQLRST